MWRTHQLAIGIATLGTFTLASWCPAQLSQEPQKRTEVETKTIKSKLKKHELATAHHYKNIYDLPFRTLTTIGTRIEQARTVPDPVALGEIAGEMKVAEEVSGKKAPLTAAELMKEAVDLVRMRHDPDELKALSLMVDDEKTRSELKEQAGVADKHEGERGARLKGGERSKGLNGTLVVVNHTDDTLYIYVDGYFQGQVQPFGANQFFVNDNPYLARTYCEAKVNGEGQKAVIQLEKPYLNSYQWDISET